MAAWGRRTVLVASLSIGASSPHVAHAQSTPPPSQVPGSVLVHVDSPKEVDLERETGDRRDPFYVACTSPCDEWVPATGRYRIAGGGTRASRRFELLANAAHETVVVSPGSTTAFGVGVAAIVIGALAAAIGAAGLLEATLGDDATGSDNSGPRNVALGLIAGGLVTEVGGITLVVANASSRVVQRAASQPNARSSPSLFPSELARRVAPTPRCPAAASWPVLRVAF